MPYLDPPSGLSHKSFNNNQFRPILSAIFIPTLSRYKLIFARLDLPLVFRLQFLPYDLVKIQPGVVLSQPRETRINFIKSRGMIPGEYGHEHRELLSSGIKDKTVVQWIKSGCKHFENVTRARSQERGLQTSGSSKDEGNAFKLKSCKVFYVACLIFHYE